MTAITDLLNKTWAIVLAGLAVLWWLLLVVPRLIRWCWRRITPQAAQKVAYLSICLVAIISIYNTRLQRQASTTNRSVLRTIEQQTSPEAVERQQRLVDGIIDVVDCNNQAALQRVIDVLVEREVLEPGDVKAITDACAELVAQQDALGD